MQLRHSIGAAHVDLSGGWLQDADVDFQVAFGDGELRLSDDVKVEGLDGASLPLLHPADAEIPIPTLRVSTHGNIRVVD